MRKNLLFRPRLSLGETKPEVIVLDGRFVDIHVDAAINFTTEEKDFFLSALNLQLQILESQNFRMAFLSLEATQTKGLSLGQVYGRVMAGGDVANQRADRILNYYVTLFYKKNLVLGSTNMSTARIKTNQYHFQRWMKDKYGRAILAGHLFHEYMHCAGFTHRWVLKETIVYKAGYLVRDIGKQVIDGKSLVRLPERQDRPLLAFSTGGGEEEDAGVLG